MVSDSSPLEEGGSEGSALFSYSEQFYLNLPFYLSIGMTPSQYWDEDCCLVKYYREADKFRRERENQSLWLQGLYIYEALCDVSPLLKPFADGKTKAVPYSAEPYPLTNAETEKRKAEKEKAAFEEMQAKTESYMNRFNAQFKKEEGENAR